MTDSPALTEPADDPDDPPKKASRTSKIVLSVVLAAVTGLVVYAVLSGNHGAIDVEQGDCIKIVSAADAQVERVDCGSAGAVYRVARKLDSAKGVCPEGAYSELTSGSSVKLCLMLNAKEGDCFTTEAIGRNRTHERVPCTDSAEYRVVKVVPDTVDSKVCAPGNVVAIYSEPPVTICLAVRP
jgi:hypothetical protein